MNYQKAKADDIITWCVANNKVDWLKKTAAKTYGDNRRKITFFELKRAFFEEFMPEQLPKAKDKAPTFLERINSL